MCMHFSVFSCAHYFQAPATQAKQEPIKASAPHRLMPYWGEGKIENAQGTIGRGKSPPGGGGQWLNAEERGAKYFSKNQNEENY